MADPSFNTSDELRLLANAFSGLVHWTWDERYNTVVGEFPREHANAVTKVLESYFSAMWDSDVIGSASELEQSVNAALGGIDEGQALYTTDPSFGDMIFCAWWRWSNGSRFSLRIGVASILLDLGAEPEDAEFIKEIFE